MGRKKKYLTEEERKEAKREQNKQYYQKKKIYYKKYYKAHKKEIIERGIQYYTDNKEKILEYRKKYSQEHPVNRKLYFKKYYNNPLSRAKSLVNAYKNADIRAGRSKCTLKPRWIIKNIFSQPCRYCGETDWTKLGCDRIDNDKPHTPDNVVPCCYKCNCKKHLKSYEDFIKEIQGSEN